VQHAGLQAAAHSWISRHPDDGRYILTNGYDWTYFTVDDAPYCVQALRLEPDRIVLILGDGTEEAWAPDATRIGADSAQRREAGITEGLTRPSSPVTRGRHSSPCWCKPGTVEMPPCASDPASSSSEDGKARFGYIHPPHAAAHR
jgi:hypothetical protein